MKMMKIRQQFVLQGTLDPFTLLKVSQAFRETPEGEALEIVYTGEQIPDELFRVLPGGEYRIAEKDRYEEPRRCRIVLEKKAESSRSPGLENGGCACE